jgi:transposase
VKKGKKPDYTKEFKEEAVKLVVEQGYRISETVKSLGVNDSAIRKWKSQR